MQEDSNKEFVSKDETQGEKNTTIPEFEFPAEDADLHALSESLKTGENAFVEPKKKKKNKLAGIVAAIAAVVVIAGAFTLQIPSVKNAVALHTMSPEKYFETVTDANIKTLAKKISSSYEKSLPYRTKNTTGALSGNLLIEFGDVLKQSLASTGLSLSSINLSFRSDYQDQVVKEALTLALNEEDAFHLICYNEASKGFYMQLPDLSSSYLYDPADSLGQGEDFEELLNSITALQEMTPEEVNTMVVSYLSYIPDHYTSISDVSSETVTIDGISDTYQTMTVSVSEKDAYNVLVDMFEKAKTDTRLTNFINSFFAQCGYPLYTVDSILDDLKEDQALADVDDLLDVTVYLDGNGIIKGVSLKPEDNPAKEEFRMVGITKGKEVKAELTYYEDGTSISSMLLSYTNTDTGATGSLTINSLSGEYLAGEELVSNASISFENLTHAGEDNKFLTGSMTITASNAPGSSLALVFGAGENTQTIKVSIQASGYAAATITIRLKTEEYQQFTLPDAASAKIYDMTKDLSGYEKEIDLDTFLDNLYKKIGLNAGSYLYGL